MADKFGYDEDLDEPKEIKKIEKQFNFVIQDHRVEMFGVCTDQCANCK